MTYQTDFPDFPEADMPALPASFTDESWVNEPCPNFDSEELKLSLFIDYLDPALREFDDTKRFVGFWFDDEGQRMTDGEAAIATDDWAEVEALFADAAARRAAYLIAEKEAGR